MPRRTLYLTRRPVLELDFKVLTYGEEVKSPEGADITQYTTGRWTVRLP